MHGKRAALEHAGPRLRIISLTAVSCSASRMLVCRRLLTTMPAWPCVTFPSCTRLHKPGLLSASLTLQAFCLSALQLAVPFVCKACFQISYLTFHVSFVFRLRCHFLQGGLLYIFVFISITSITTRNYLIYLYSCLFPVSPTQYKLQERLLALFLASVQTSA